MSAVLVETHPTVPSLLDELRKQYPAATAQMPTTTRGAIAWLNIELNALYEDPSNTSNAYNRRYGINLQNALVAIEEASRYEQVWEEVGASV